jgi:hypothetical protein
MDGKVAWAKNYVVCGIECNFREKSKYILMSLM